MKKEWQKLHTNLEVLGEILRGHASLPKNSFGGLGAD